MDPPNNGLGPAPSETDQPSCQGCRRRKLRCSRDKPVCTHCQRLGSPCVYDAKKSKPGVKPGAIEALNRRVESLESAVFDSQGQIVREPGSTASPATQDVVGVFSSLIQELRGLVHTNVPAPHQHVSPTSIHPNLTSSTPGSFASPNDGANGGSRNADGHGQGRSRKRRRVDSCGNPNIELADQLVQLANDSTKLPPPEILEEIIGAYFSVIQPWIPVVHETRFRRRLNHDEHTPEMVVLLHAMVVAATRFVDCDVLRLSVPELEAWMSRSRGIVRLSAMEGMSVENLQALIIIAFHDMGNGDMAKAWPLIGSLTRTVEYLQLSVETDDPKEGSLLKPLSTIEPAQNWTQDEERRRVFWTIFNLDRLCSVMTGWNTSLTSDDVRRRLPACGGIWHKEDPVTTPYFGIWDRSAAKIGNSIAFLPAHYPSPEQTVDAPPETPASAPGGNAAVDMTTVGAFAYCVEATESLSRVTTYFLQQGIDFRDRQQVGNWLTRFKELDLRLVHWKMFLPRRWKDSNISRKETHVEMDPNLTLAHVTHNTSMVLLHQQIAYPPPRWTGIVRMPSAHSAETCQVAAAETATIAQKYLRYTPWGGPVSSQFAFCVFISARALLVHWRYYAELAPEFWLLVECLDDMSKRWGGSFGRLGGSDLAGRYAAQLRSLHGKCSGDSDFSLDVLGYVADGFPEHSARHQPKEPNDSNGDHGVPTAIPPRAAPASNVEPIRDRPGDPRGPISAVGLSSMLQTSPTSNHFEQHSQDELSAISTALMDQDFTQLDRVISFDDMSFSVQACNGDATTLNGVANTLNGDAAALAGGSWNFGQ